jgi:hypothetical protein
MTTVYKYRKIVTWLLRLNFKTLYFNLKYLPLKQAIKLPIWISRHVFLMQMAGKIVIDSPNISTRMICIGFGGVGTFDHHKSRSIWKVAGTVVFKGKTLIGHGSKISVDKDSTLTLGKEFTITAESSIVCCDSIQFGDGCLLSWDILVMDTDFHKIKNPSNHITNAPQPIVIGNNVWIGCRSVILKGSVIPNSCVIGASSFVNRVLDTENAVYGGYPARVLKDGITWEV